MANHSYHKSRPLLLHQYLLTNSDPQHPVTTAQCMEYLASRQRHGDRKSLYGDMEALQEVGIDIQYRRGKGGGWYIEERTFTLPDLRRLVDALEAFPHLDKARKEELITKLENLTSIRQREQLHRPITAIEDATITEQDLYPALDKLHQAIRTQKAVSFYTHGGREQKRHTVTPYTLIYTKEGYLLVGYDHGTATVGHHWVHQMEGVVVTALSGVSVSKDKTFSIERYLEVNHIS